MAKEHFYIMNILEDFVPSKLLLESIALVSCNRTSSKTTGIHTATYFLIVIPSAFSVSIVKRSLHRELEIFQESNIGESHTFQCILSGFVQVQFSFPNHVAVHRNWSWLILAIVIFSITIGIQNVITIGCGIVMSMNRINWSHRSRIVIRA